MTSRLLARLAAVAALIGWAAFAHAASGLRTGSRGGDTDIDVARIGVTLAAASTLRGADAVAARLNADLATPLVAVARLVATDDDRGPNDRRRQKNRLRRVADDGAASADAVPGARAWLSMVAGLLAAAAMIGRGNARR